MRLGSLVLLWCSVSGFAPRARDGQRFVSRLVDPGHTEVVGIVSGLIATGANIVNIWLTRRRIKELDKSIDRVEDGQKRLGNGYGRLEDGQKSLLEDVFERLEGGQTRLDDGQETVLREVPTFVRRLLALGPRAPIRRGRQARARRGREALLASATCQERLRLLDPSARGDARAVERRRVVRAHPR